MGRTTTNIEKNNHAIESDDVRWQAVVERDPAADGAFYCCVRTTGVYCRNVCSARLPLRKNVVFHDTCQDAEAAGFRPCKRCRPRERGGAIRQVALVEQACRLMDQSSRELRLAELANAVGVSSAYLHRVFKERIGLTPKSYAAGQRGQRLRNALRRSRTVTSAIHESGYSSSGRFYGTSPDPLGMSPRAYRRGGRGETIRFAIGECWLGDILVAATDKGICAILLGDDPDALVRDVQDRFPDAEFIGCDRDFESIVAKVVGLVSDPKRGVDLPLDLRGTVFQRQVWEALRRIPAGSTTTYTEVARRLGRPEAVRAVASAIAANPLAVAIPCHRVVRTDGSLSGYRWGVERKRDLIERERVKAPAVC